ncbi:hypothetical protein WR25_09756 isoform E [Diploscapter pachys]|uniref:Uncharacterized protein n=1 Tax=Diploscapter pachys TaxID=2018661 RepID=A0A2A2K3G3_9BILA|nr:hypothetical protein WR25_09756 isoform D [Diploscapter pachys]PAV68413.1 hypothetical protein WR25_09756 isoform E [Diploscapter pachys]
MNEEVRHDGMESENRSEANHDAIYYRTKSSGSLVFCMFTDNPGINSSEKFTASQSGIGCSSTSSTSSTFSLEKLENVVRIPNKPRLSIDASARATDGIRLSPEFLDTLSIPKKDDNVIRQLSDANRLFSTFGPYFDSFYGVSALERLRNGSLRRRLLAQEPDLTKPTTSNEAASSMQNDAEQEHGTAFRPFRRTRLGDFPSTQSLFEMNDLPSAMSTSSQFEEFRRKESFHEEKFSSSSGFQTPTTALGAAFQDFSLGKSAFNPVLSNRHHQHKTGYRISDLLDDTPRNLRRSADWTTDMKSFPSTEAATGEGGAVVPPKIHRVPIKLIQHSASNIDLPSSSRSVSFSASETDNRFSPMKEEIIDEIMESPSSPQAKHARSQAFGQSHGLNIMFSIFRRPLDHQRGCPISHLRSAFLYLQFCQFIRLQTHGRPNSQSAEANRRAHCRFMSSCDAECKWIRRS